MKSILTLLFLCFTSYANAFSLSCQLDRVDAKDNFLETVMQIADLSVTLDNPIEITSNTGKYLMQIRLVNETTIHITVLRNGEWALSYKDDYGPRGAGSGDQVEDDNGTWLDLHCWANLSREREDGE